MRVELDEILSSLHVVRLPLITRFRGIEEREVALFQGPHGWGEFSPFLEYGAEESSRWLAAGIEAAFQPPLEKEHDFVSINATLPAVDDLHEIPTILERYPGARTVKMKMTDDMVANMERIKRVREIEPEIQIRLDVNGAWSVEQAVRFLEPLSSEIEYVEQPCESVEELRELKSKIEIKVAIDEVIRKSDDPCAIDLTGAADLIVVKSSPLGGVRRALAIADHFALPYVVSSALESAVGISQGLELAASRKSYSRASGLATGSLFAKDVGVHPIKDGAIEVKRISPSSLDTLAVEHDRFQWWENRVRECHEVLFA